MNLIAANENGIQLWGGMSFLALGLECTVNKSRELPW